MDVTLFELHLPDAEFNAPFSRGRAAAADAEAEVDAEAAAAGDGDASSGSRLAPLVALAALAGLALLARYLRGGEAEQSTLDELEA